MQNVVTAFNAKTHFSQLLDRASKGEEILITKRGVMFAKIVPVNNSHNVETAKIAATQLRKLAKEINAKPSDWQEWMNYKNVGRK